MTRAELRTLFERVWHMEQGCQRNLANHLMVPGDMLQAFPIPLAIVIHAGQSKQLVLLSELVDLHYKGEEITSQ